MTADVRDTVERFREGWEDLNAYAVLATFSRDPSLLVWGTDADEEWRGFEALVAPFRSQTVAFTEPRYAWQGDPVVWSGEDIGCVAGTLQVSLRTEGGVVSVRMRSTFVLARERGSWQIVHAHFSVGQAEQVAPYG
ncbi:MAG: nuclear transport factor 2 family protein [Actinomycetota bacterium]